MDVKKIDIGGGLIHGEASDFKKDQSKKMILSHTALSLRPDQREIGSGAPFGTADVLLPSYQDNTRRYAFEYLQHYLPTVPTHALRTLLNTSVETFNPETILLKEGDEVESIYLLLTGSVELLKTSNNLHAMVSAGSLVGEMTALHQLPAMETYRALTFVKAMRIPSKLYRAVVEKYQLFADIIRLMEGREFLQATWLFGDSLSYTIQNRVADEMCSHYLEKGQTFSLGTERGVCIIRQGEATLYYKGIEVETLGRGDFFGEDSVVFNQDCSFTIKAHEGCECCTISADSLNEIPIVQWKLIENMECRRHLMASR
jgi:hemerythrin